ncbi:MAG: DUF349 domain-containing protein [Flavobacteriales bacterium CG_4_10_14_0_2_um_filter_35_18]|nr:MAG: DUF349 domain-containing protein [Flavobacteriales bacterium CG_4_10_14_0_2_um_filter_35_18]
MLDEIKENTPLENLEETNESATTNEANSTVETPILTSQETTEALLDEVILADEPKTKPAKALKSAVKDQPLADDNNADLETLVETLDNLVNNGPINKIKDEVEAIKTVFDAKFKTLLETQKAAFIAEGGDSIDFHFSTPYKTKYNELLNQYKKTRAQFYKALDQELQDNLKIKLDIIKALKELIDNVEDTNKYVAFKNLQERWNKVGQIPRNNYNDTWQTYLHHVERFYDLLHINNDLRDLDFKHNLDEKEKLIKRAEKLASEPNIDVAFKELQQLHKAWKEDIGPVQKEIREEVWNRFSDATKVIHDKRHEAFKDIKVEFDENAAKKEALITSIAAFNPEMLKSHADWQNAIKSIDKCRDEFFKVGRVSRKQNEALWKKFKEATQLFNSGKNEFYKLVKNEQLDNLTKKRNLLNQAQTLKDSEDIVAAAEVFKKIQAEWKNIGHVPRKYSDKIWHEFKDACNHFFERIHAEKEVDNHGQIEAFNAKKVYLEALKKKAEDSKLTVTQDNLQEYIKDWKTLGYVPDGKRQIEDKFNKFLEKSLEDLDLDKKDLAFIKYKMLMDGYKATNNIKKIENEQFFLIKKIDELTREIQQLDNNMSFFSNTTESNPLFANVLKTLKKNQEDLKVLKEKYDYLKTL